MIQETVEDEEEKRIYEDMQQVYKTTYSSEQKNSYTAAEESKEESKQEVLTSTSNLQYRMPSADVQKSRSEASSNGGAALIESQSSQKSLNLNKGAKI